MIGTAKDKLLSFLRSRYYKRKRKRLKNLTPSIISSDCIGGVIYHDMGLQFRSPTINLWFNQTDFLKFASDLRYYLNCELVEVFEDGIEYPIGLLTKGTESVKVYFMHYKTFDEAAAAWKKRSERVDFDNLYVILEQAEPLSQESDIWKMFCALEIKNKVIITGQTDFEDDSIVHMDIYDESYYSGKILSKKKPFCIKRYLDDFDYVSFLNR